jgi:hypothetical protein
MNLREHGETDIVSVTSKLLDIAFSLGFLLEIITREC